MVSLNKRKISFDFTSQEIQLFMAGYLITICFNFIIKVENVDVKPYLCH